MPMSIEGVVAMLELLYASGLRVSELVTLKTVHVGFTDGTLHVTGKGSKERLVPFGEEALSWLERYLREARAAILDGQASDALFVTARGGPMTRQMFWKLLKAHALSAGIAVPLSPHTVRHGGLETMRRSSLRNRTRPAGPGC